MAGLVTAVFKLFRPSLLTDIVDAIWDWDIPDGDAAKTIIIKYPPGTSFFVVVEYRVPIRVDWRFSGSSYEVSSGATRIQTGSVNLRPRGPLGAIIVCMKPDAAYRVIGAPIREFTNVKIKLCDLFRAADVSLFDEMLAEARTSGERIALVEAFLLRNLRPPRDYAACFAAARLRCDPVLSITQLASQLSLSDRQLLRDFRAMFGSSPKQFARQARIEKVLTAWREGMTWTKVAYDCGFADQAHLTHEFKDIVGELPTEFFGNNFAKIPARVNGANFVVQHTTKEKLELPFATIR